MTLEIGTRTKATLLQSAAPSGTQTRSLAGDVGMTKLATASTTFATSGATATAADGTFAAFAVNDLVLVEGTNENNGYFTVTGLDATNQAFLVLSPPPKNEGPVTATIRTA